jgi:two-component system cell cycle response regulator PopA
VSARAVILTIGAEDAHARLRGAGFGVVSAHAPKDLPAPDVVLIDARGRPDHETLRLAQDARFAAAPKQVAVIALIGAADLPPAADVFDGLLPDGPSVSLVAARIEAALRRKALEEEAAARAETLAAFGAALEALAPPAQQAPRILLVGEPGALTLKAASALEAHGAVIVGAFTSFNAFDYLHEAPFDAVVTLAPGEDWSGQLGLIATMRRSARFYHTPGVVIGASFGEAQIEAAVAKGADDIVDADLPMDTAAARIVTLALGAQRQAGLRAAFAKTRPAAVIDRATCLYNAAFLKGHLDRLCARAEASGRPLAIVAARVREDDRAAGLRHLGAYLGVFGQASAMIARLVRAEDVAARLDANLLIIAMPGSDELAARKVAERIEGVLACTAFDTGTGVDNAQIAFDLAALSRAPLEGAAGLLARARQRLEQAAPPAA